MTYSIRSIVYLLFTAMLQYGSTLYNSRTYLHGVPGTGPNDRRHRRALQSYDRVPTEN